MKQKKLIILFSSIVFMFSGCKEKELAGPLMLLPSSVQAVAQVSNLEKAYEGTGLLEQKFFGISAQDLKKDPEAFFGFNPFSLEGLNSVGIDPRGTLGVALADFQERDGEVGIKIAFYVSVSDEAKMISKVKEMVQKNIPEIQFQDEKGMISFKPGPYSSKIYFFVKEGYLFVVFSDPRQDARDFALSIGGDTHFSDQPRFREVAEKMEGASDVLVYADLGMILDKTLPVISKLFMGMPGASAPGLEYLKDYQGFLLALNLADPNLKMTSVMALKEGSVLLDIFKGVSVQRPAVLNVSDPLVLLMSFALNPVKYADFLKKQFPGDQQEMLLSGLSRELEVLKTQFGIDPRKDLLENLNGNFNLAVYDGKSITMTNYNTLFSIGVKDESKMKSVLEKLIEKLPQEIKPMITRQGNLYVVTVMGFVQIFIGVSDGAFSIATGKNLSEQVFSKKGESFVSKVDDQELKKWIQGETQIFYLNVDEMVLALKNFASLLPYISDQQGGLSESFLKKAGQFHYLAAASTQKDRFFSSDMVLKTRFKEPFFKALSRMISESQ